MLHCGPLDSVPTMSSFVMVNWEQGARPMRNMENLSGQTEGVFREALTMRSFVTVKGAQGARLIRSIENLVKQAHTASWKASLWTFLPLRGTSNLRSMSYCNSRHPQSAAE